MHGFTFKLIFGGKGLGGTKGDLVLEVNELGGNIKEEGATTMLLER